MAHAVFDKRIFKNPQQMENEIRNGKIVLTNSVGKFLMQKGRIEKYTKEEPDIDINKTRLNFDIFVFSGEQLKAFVNMVNNHKNTRIIH